MSGPGPVRDFGTERALAEPLGPIYMIFPNSSPHFTLLTELNLTVPKARPEPHTFDFITSVFQSFVCLYALGDWSSGTSLQGQFKGPLNRSRSGSTPPGPRRYTPYPRNQRVGALHDETRGSVCNPTGEVLITIVSDGLHE